MTEQITPELPEEIPEDLSQLPKKEAILMAAKLEFLERGYQHTSMDAVAERAGTTKRTVYNHFANKEELFAGIVGLSSQLFALKLPELDPADPDVEGMLLRYVARFTELTSWRDAVRVQRAVIAEYNRMPALATELYRNAAGTAIERLSVYLAALSKAGALKVGNPDLAARQLFGICGADLRFRTLFGDLEPLSEISADMSARELDRAPIASGIAVFLSHYRT